MRLRKALTRTKRCSVGDGLDGPLARVLSTFDLVALGTGSTLGVGIYVLAGDVARNLTGPAVILSFLLAAMVAAFAGLSFAEFGSRVPKAGSAYVYSYYCVGELVAFIIGWSLLLEFSIGAASVAKGISAYVNSMTNETLEAVFTSVAPLDAPLLAPYVDFFAMALCLVFSVVLAVGVKLSSRVNNVFTLINICIVIYVICAGIVLADVKNWEIPKAEIPAGIKAGEGGFAPYGLSGVIKGASICFYGFIGFDTIATSGEEVRNPQRALPVAIITSLVIILAAYLGVSSVITLMIPYYLQDSDAPLPFAFKTLGWHTAKWVVSIGALFGLFSSLFCALFPLPRITYSMASDGLLFRWLAKVHPRYQTPFLGTLVTGALSAIIAAIFDLQQLVGLNAIGTLLTYILVSICVVILRFQAEDEVTPGEATSLLPRTLEPSAAELFTQFVTCRRFASPNRITARLVTIELLIFCFLSILLSLSINILIDDIAVLSVIVTIILGIKLVLVCSMASQPSSSQKLTFKMPLVPYIPCFNIMLNVYLMVILDPSTWIRFGACMLIDA